MRTCTAVTSEYDTLTPYTSCSLMSYVFTNDLRVDIHPRTILKYYKCGVEYAYVHV